jgi:hypothetical protein
MLAGAGCGEDHDHGNENEVITTVTLTLVSAGGAPVVVKFDDPDGDGGNPPKVDALDIAAGMYDLTVKLENRLENPAEDITAEVRDEGDEHQIFFTGTAVKGPASNQASAPLTHSYADMDTKGLPIGIANKISATAGTGTLTVTLRHLPPVNGMPVKTAALPEQVRNGGFAAIGGSSDAQVNFQVNVR